jgi:hypothetical protein
VTRSPDASGNPQDATKEKNEITAVPPSPAALRASASPASGTGGIAASSADARRAPAHQPVRRDLSARELLGPDGPFAREVPGFVPRDCQQAMAEAVEEAIAEGQTLIACAIAQVGRSPPLAERSAPNLAGLNPARSRTAGGTGRRTRPR